MGERKRETVEDRGRERERGSMRIGKERKSPCKTDVPKMYAYNECEHSVNHYIRKYSFSRPKKAKKMNIKKLTSI